MAFPRYRIRTLMIAVAVLAIDCALVPFAQVLAGGLVLGVAMEIGLLGLTSVRGKARRFWIGFEAAGSVALVAYAAAVYSRPIALVAWVYTLFNFINRSLTYLPYGLYAGLRRHVIINPYAPLRVIDLVILHEVSFGLPMLLQAILCGMFAARRPWLSIAPDPLMP